MLTPSLVVSGFEVASRVGYSKENQSKFTVGTASDQIAADETGWTGPDGGSSVLMCEIRLTVDVAPPTGLRRGGLVRR